MSQSTDSYGRQVWKRLRKKKAVFISLLVIVFAAAVAGFGYAIAPDNSPFADLQTVEIQARKPGYTQLFLKIPNHKQPETTLFSRLLYGKTSACTYLPITAYEVQGDSLTVQKYVDEDTTVMQRYALSMLTGNSNDKIEDAVVQKKYYLGTDAFGRDILSRIIIGTRVSLSVGLIAVIISLLIGTLLGA